MKKGLKFFPMNTAPRDGTVLICRFTKECGGGTRKVSWGKAFAGMGWSSLQSPINQQIMEDCFDGWHHYIAEHMG